MIRLKICALFLMICLLVSIFSSGCQTGDKKAAARRFDIYAVGTGSETINLHLCLGDDSNQVKDRGNTVKCSPEGIDVIYRTFGIRNTAPMRLFRRAFASQDGYGIAFFREQIDQVSAHETSPACDCDVHQSMPFCARIPF